MGVREQDLEEAAARIRSRMLAAARKAFPLSERRAMQSVIQTMSTLLAAHEMEAKRLEERRRKRVERNRARREREQLTPLLPFPGGGVDAGSRGQQNPE